MNISLHMVPLKEKQILSLCLSLAGVFSYFASKNVVTNLSKNFILYMKHCCVKKLNTFHTKIHTLMREK